MFTTGEKIWIVSTIIYIILIYIMSQLKIEFTEILIIGTFSYIFLVVVLNLLRFIPKRKGKKQ
jgi:hypothetical protein